MNLLSILAASAGSPLVVSIAASSSDISANVYEPAGIDEVETPLELTVGALDAVATPLTLALGSWAELQAAAPSTVWLRNDGAAAPISVEVWPSSTLVSQRYVLLPSGFSEADNARAITLQPGEILKVAEVVAASWPM